MNPTRKSPAFARFKQVIETRTTRTARIFDTLIQSLILFSVVTFSIETVPEIGNRARSFFSIAETIAVAIFTVEYLSRVFVADKKLRFIFSFYGLVDLLSILPFYVARGIDLRSLRVFRLFRVFRIFKVLRYSKALDRFRLSFSAIRDELILFGVASLFLAYLAAVGVYYFENPAQPEIFASVFHSFWWAVATLTTVGYGDIYPVTVGGKVFTCAILAIGLGVVAIPAGLIASAMTKTVAEEDES